MSEVKTLATLVLGGAFDATELGDNEIYPDMGLIDALQQKLVTGFDDVSIELVSRSDLDSVQSELAALREELERQKHYVEINANSAHGKHKEGQQYKDERDALREDLAAIIANRNDLKQRLTAAEQRNAVLVEALTEERRIRLLGQQPNINWESLRDVRRACYAKTDAALKPTESGASE